MLVSLDRVAEWEDLGFEAVEAGIRRNLEEKNRILKELYHREVMNLAPYAHELSALGMLRWIELGGDLSADTEEELLAKIHAKYGSNVQMKKAGRIVLYCAESKCEVNVPRVVNSQDANGNWFAESKLVAEIALLSDREPNAEQDA